MNKIALLIVVLILPLSSACKDIIVMDEATSGNYNLFMKVRDPSRSGLQVLFILNEGYEYNYHHPWRNYEMAFKTKYKIIGVATSGDIPPNIVKAGMMMTSAGLAYGDADVPTYWINPTKRAWDDFDWLRYAAQQAGNEKEAVALLEEVVDMHAPGIGENLFVVGKEAYVIEADALHFYSREVQGLEVMSNYPKYLWKSRFLRKIGIASSFDKVFDGYVFEKEVVRIGGIYGIRVVEIKDDYVIVKQFPLGEETKIEKGNGSKVGNFYVEFKEANGRKAKLRVCYEYYEWENRIGRILNEKYRNINVIDLMNISRIHSWQIEGLRGLCENEMKACMIFKIPLSNPEILMAGWFAPDQCSSIFIPVHICDYEIYDDYENGKAAEISLSLLRKYGHGNVSFGNFEEVLVYENEKVEDIAMKNIDMASEILTSVDVEMQKQAIILQKIFLNSSYEERENLRNLWKKDYYTSICEIEKNIDFLKNFSNELGEIILSMCKTRVDIERIVNGSKFYDEYKKAENYFKEGNYKKGIEIVKDIFEKIDKKIYGIEYKKLRGVEIIAVVLPIVILIMLLLFIYRKLR
ncbi:MAG: hypothetical protein H5T44_02705 [Thermoplasmatales archaeon]|nr:hypothetical protein [Thermoplasmatales archaeon]